MRSFGGAVAVVTGAGSGIGRALAVALTAAGAVVVISDVDGSGLEQTVDLLRKTQPRALPPRADVLDVTDREAVQHYAESVATEFGRVELVVNNAGVSHGGDVLGMSFADVERVMAVDFWGVVHGSKAFLPHLIASGRGNLVNVSSLFGLVPMAGQSAYVAAKYAVRGFTESLRMEMLAARHPVQVTCVHPGGVRTSIARNGTVNEGENPSGRSDLFEEKLARTSADEAAAIILRGAARGRPRVLVGNDARLAHLVGTLSNRMWQRAAVMALRRM